MQGELLGLEKGLPWPLSSSRCYFALPRALSEIN